jgi:hypothetical protein
MRRSGVVSFEQTNNFVERLQALRHDGVFSFMLDSVEIHVMPQPELLNEEACPLRQTGEHLRTLVLDLNVKESDTERNTRFYISAGTWGYGISLRDMYYLFIHDFRRCKAHQIKLHGLLTEGGEPHLTLEGPSKSLSLTTRIRFPIRGGGGFRQALVDWLVDHGVPQNKEELLVVGNSGDYLGILRNLIVIGMLKQHLRGHFVLSDLANQLTPREQ